MFQYGTQVDGRGIVKIGCFLPSIPVQLITIAVGSLMLILPTLAFINMFLACFIAAEALCDVHEVN